MTVSMRSRINYQQQYYKSFMIFKVVDLCLRVAGARVLHLATAIHFQLLQAGFILVSNMSPTLSGELQYFHSDSTPPLSNTALMQSVYRILCHTRETLLKLNFLQLMERHCSWDNVLISIYQTDALDLKNKNLHAREQ